MADTRRPDLWRGHVELLDGDRASSAFSRGTRLDQGVCLFQPALPDAHGAGRAGRPFAMPDDAVCPKPFNGRANAFLASTAFQPGDGKEPFIQVVAAVALGARPDFHFTVGGDGHSLEVVFR